MRAIEWVVLDHAKAQNPALDNMRPLNGVVTEFGMINLLLFESNPAKLIPLIQTNLTAREGKL